MKKYYVYRISRLTGLKEYKLHKTLDNWVGVSLRERCWKFSRNGASGIVKWNSERHGWHYAYGVEEVLA